MTSDKTGFLEELKRRHVWRVAVAYAVAGWLIVQIATQVFPFFNIPNWGVRLVVILIAIGFPVAVAFAWIYELTPEGIRRTEPADSPDARPAPVNRQLGRKLNAIIVATLVLAVALLGWRLFAVRHDAATNPAKTAAFARATPAVSTDGKVSAATTRGASATSLVTSPVTVQPIPAKSVAVLPFENLSTDKGNAYFADGMQDLILTKLADIGDLKVISRTSTLQYGSHPENLTLVGKQLGVATILEGSVQKAGNQVLINVQLIDAQTDNHLWAESYTRTLDNIFGVEGEVAAKVAKALNAKLTAPEKQAIAQVLTHNKQALDAFLKGIYYINDETATLDVAELKKSIALLEQATRLDPHFAAAFSALSLAYQHLGGHLPQAEAAAKRALALNPDDPEAHRMVAYTLMYQRKFAQALVQAKEAVRLAPDSAIINNGLGNVYGAAGNLDAAAATYRHALALDPRANIVRMNLSGALMEQHHYDGALNVLQTATVHDPSSILAATQLAWVQELGWGNLTAARQALQGVMTPIASSGALSDAWFWLDFYKRDYPAALAVIQHAPQSWFEQQGYPLSLYQAQVYRAQDDGQRARQAFAQARATLEAGIAKSSGSAERNVSLSLALAGLGDADGAVAEAQHAVKLAGINSYDQCLLNVAVVDAWTGKVDPALKRIDDLLGKPNGYVISVSLLKLDPTWDPIRHDPRFQALLKKYGGSQAASATASTSAASASQTH